MRFFIRFEIIHNMVHIQRESSDTNLKKKDKNQLTVFLDGGNHEYLHGYKFYGRFNAAGAPQ